MFCHVNVVTEHLHKELPEWQVGIIKWLQLLIFCHLGSII